MVYEQEKYSVYGISNRRAWIKSHISLSEKIIDIGCGTGWSITLPLIQEKYDVYGFDLCSSSIALGTTYAQDLGIEERRLFCSDFSLITYTPHVVILSEVLEHLEDQSLEHLMQLVHRKIDQKGKVLITVPHGYAWFEIENYIYTRLGIKKIFNFLRIESVIIIIKNKILGFNTVSDRVSTVDSSPHVQRFTYYSLQKRLEKYGFRLKEKKGGVFICGPISNTFFSGFKTIQKINVWLGSKMPWIAADLYFCFEKVSDE